MDTLGNLCDDEIHLIKMYREADRLARARIMLATMPPHFAPGPEEAQLLEFYALYLECSDYGRERIRETTEIFANSDSVEDARKRLAELDEARPTAEILEFSRRPAIPVAP